MNGTQVSEQKFSVNFNYPVYFTRNIFDNDNPALEENIERLNEGRIHKVAVYIDRGVHDKNMDLVQKINDYFHQRYKKMELAAPPQILPGGYEAKTNWELVKNIMWTIGNLHLDRQSFIIAVGGGNMLDMTGFATSIVHRGLRLVRVPTTTLAQGDAGLGVKNGMDEHGQKNFAGTFSPPFAVINDFEFLKTLTDQDWISGIAEAFKVAIIKDMEFLQFLGDKAEMLRKRDQETMEKTIQRCAQIHLDHITTSGDPFEFGSARPLDFGHWAAHKLEVMSNYRLSHGQAVSIGIALDSFYACEQNLISRDERNRIITGLSQCGLPVWHELLSSRSAEGELDIINGLETFREHLGGILNITLPNGIGRKIEVHHMDVSIIEEGVKFLKNFNEINRN